MLPAERRPSLLLVATALLVIVAALPVRAQDDMTYEDFVDKYGDWTIDDVEAAGYVVDAHCVTAEDEGLPADYGAMGFHAINPEYLLDGEADPRRPDAILLDADQEVVGIEFEIPEVVDPPPAIAGIPLEITPPHAGMDFEHMSLHIYFVGDEANRYSPFNPAVACPESSDRPADDGGDAHSDMHESDGDSDREPATESDSDDDGAGEESGYPSPGGIGFGLLPPAAPADSDSESSETEDASSAIDAASDSTDYESQPTDSDSDEYADAPSDEEDSDESGMSDGDDEPGDATGYSDEAEETEADETEANAAASAADQSDGNDGDMSSLQTDAQDDAASTQKSMPQTNVEAATGAAAPGEMPTAGLGGGALGDLRFMAALTAIFFGIGIVGVRRERHGV